MTNSVFVVDSLSSDRRGVDFTILEDDAALALHSFAGTSVVNAIFPWGTDAVFNRIQIPSLLAEWRRVVSEINGDEPAKENLRIVLEFLEGRVASDADKYVVFVAD